MNKKKLVRIVPELDFGGVEQVLANSIPYLLSYDALKIKIIVLGKGGEVSTRLKEMGVDVRILNVNQRIPNFKLLFQLVSVLKENKTDVVHTQGAEANFHGIWAAKIAKIPIIIGEEIGIPNHHSYWKWIFRWLYRKADFVIAISKAVKNHIVELKELKEEKIRVVYNPVGLRDKIQDKGEEVSYESLLKSNKDIIVFVTTCRLVPIKNLDSLILVFQKLVLANPENNLRLDIIGDGPEKKKLQKLVLSKGLVDKIRFLGFQDNVFSFLKESNVFVLPSFTEGSSVSLAEAMVQGLPSIVTKNGGASEILGHSKSGILIDPYRPESILKAMQDMIGFSPSHRNLMGLRAQKEADRFSVEKYVKSLLEIYNN